MLVLTLTFVPCCSQVSDDSEPKAPDTAGAAGAPTVPGDAAGSGARGVGDAGASASAGAGGDGSDAGAASSGHGDADTIIEPEAGGAGGASSADDPGGQAGDTGADRPLACSIDATATLSSAIPTVGILTFATDLESLQRAEVEFGLDTSYGLTAPVELEADAHRTLLLGMKSNHTYHYRVVLHTAHGVCTGDDATITTGPPPQGYWPVDVETTGAADRGFLVTGYYRTPGLAFILDSDGDMVWWYDVQQSNVISARMSYDGKYMWLGSDGLNATMVRRVSMDGLEDEDFSAQFQGENHELTVLPDETVVFDAYTQGPCDDIRERSPDGSVRTVVNAATAEGLTGDDLTPCHVNSVQYSPWDDSLIFSDLNHNNITKIRRDGTVVWVLGGPTNQFMGDGAVWTKQHGLHILGIDHFLFFNNGDGLSGSAAVEVQLDVEKRVATNVWSYLAYPPINNAIMGDVQLLDSGNRIVAYSTQGVLHQVNAQGELLQTMTWHAGFPYGYISFRRSLYGPPPR